ncbi:hypothetical protein FQN53_002216 [Emmonsiellopsis sp. PD_33]|nr:hypothetical protein FQN53_002216 [Emmonsiellopsis sp. PD_33]
MRFQIPVIAALGFHIFTTPTGAFSFKLPPFRKDSNHPPSRMVYSDADLPSLLNVQASQQNGVLSDAIELLNAMKSSPSCNRIAATDLILSCQSISENDKDRTVSVADSLENVKSLFAARLAICEHIGAGAAIPDQCSPVLTSSRARHPRLEEEDLLQPSQLGPCLKALETRPQWWTSYSNSRQNAAVMCQAARIEIEKEERLKRYEDLADVTSILTDSLNQSFRETVIETARHKAFIEVVEEMRDTLFQNLEDGMLRYENLAANIFNGMEEVRGSIFETKSEASNVAKDLSSSAHAMRDLKRSLHEIHLANARRASELTEIERRNHEESLDLLSSARESVKSLMSQDLQLIAEDFNNIYYSMQAVKDFITSMEGKHDSLDSRFQLFDQVFEQFETKAVSLQQAQMQQMEDHVRLQKMFQTDIRITQALLTEVTTSAANLQTSVDDTFKAFSKIASLGGVVSSMYWWLAVSAVAFFLPPYPRFVWAGTIWLLHVVGIFPTGIVDLWHTLESLPGEYIHIGILGLITVIFGVPSMILLAVLIIDHRRQARDPIPDLDPA